MKKVGILTLPLNENFGGILQAVALYGFLSDRGYSVVFLNNRIFRPTWKFWLVRILERLPFQDLRGARSAYRKSRFHSEFLSKFIPNRTRPLCFNDDFKRVCNEENFDSIVVGSDQVWRWDYISDGYGRYFLDFLSSSGTRKVSYAASFGKNVWQAPGVAKEVAAMLADFHAVSTREADGVSICREMGRLDCRHVLDPTLLVGVDFYQRFLTPKSEIQEYKVLLTYVLDESSEKRGFVDFVRRGLGEQYRLVEHGLKSDLSVPDWVSAFRDADYVITDSFHGMVFSILFNKPFIVLANSQRGVSRFQSLLEALGLESRLISENGLNSVSMGTVLESIDYASVNRALEVFREESSRFLLESVG